MRVLLLVLMSVMVWSCQKKEEFVYPRDYADRRTSIAKLFSDNGLRHLAIKVPVALENHSEELFVDVGTYGLEDPKISGVILSISGVHGVEGLIGSDIQHEILKNFEPQARFGYVFYHGYNPFGLKYFRRVDQDNVDLNRNFHIVNGEVDHARYQGVRKIYDDLYSFINEPSWMFKFYAGLYTWLYGMDKLKQGICGGQYEYPDGIYYGGKDIQIANRAFFEFIKTLPLKPIYGIEIHSGLGDFGEDVYFTNLTEGYLFDKLVRDGYKLENSWQSAHNGDEVVGYDTSGDLLTGVPQMRSSVKWFLQEFGTLSEIAVLRALQFENFYFNSLRNKDDWAKGPIPKDTQRLIEAFYPSSEEWRSKVIKRGVEFFKAVESHS